MEIKKIELGGVGRRRRTSGIDLQTKIAAVFVVGVVVLAIVFGVVKKTNDFFMEHYLVFNRPVEVKFRPPVEIKQREEKIKIVEIVKGVENLPEPKTPLEQYICEKFGVADCKIAIAVARAESGMDETAYNYNKNGTLDIGIFQINEVHWDRPGCSPKELFDAYRNVDCAYQIWKEQGWEPWVGFNNGSFIRHLSK